MQTFLPYPEFRRSLECLDSRRLGKQRVEAMQILNAFRRSSGGWVNHPAKIMWTGYENALRLYHNLAIEIWAARGFRNGMLPAPIDGPVVFPPWLGDEAFHAAHRSNLLRKDPLFYGRYGWTEPPDLPYVWPGCGSRT